MIRLSTSHRLYLLCHGVLALLGLLLMFLDGQVVSTGTVMVAVGASLLAMGVGGVVLFLNVWMNQEEAERLNVMRRFGLRQIFPARSVGIRKEYDQRLRVAKESVDIMGFGLRNLREDYGGAFATWAQRATVRILLVDPEFPTADGSVATLRDREEGSGDIRADVRQFILSCRHLVQDPSSRFHVRLYRCLPTVNLFRIDHEVFWGPYLIGDVSRNMPTLLMSDGQLTARLTEHFDRVWGSEEFSRDVPNAWLQG